MTPALEIQGLHVHAGGRVLVEDASLALAPGSVLVVLGESGSGKSLLAQAIMGTLPKGLVASGAIVIAGEDVDRLSPEARSLSGGGGSRSCHRNLGLRSIP